MPNMTTPTVVEQGVGRKRRPSEAVTLSQRRAPWSEAEHSALLTHWPFLDRLAVLLPGRTVDAIKTRAWCYGLNDPPGV